MRLKMNYQELTATFTSLHLTNTQYRYRGGYDESNGVVRFAFKTEIILFAGGNFQYSVITTEQSSVSTPHNTKATIRKGTWSIYYNDRQSALLVLSFDNDEQLKFSINYHKNDGIMLNGKRFCVERNMAEKKENSINPPHLHLNS